MCKTTRVWPLPWLASVCCTLSTMAMPGTRPRLWFHRAASGCARVCRASSKTRAARKAKCVFGRSYRGRRGVSGGVKPTRRQIVFHSARPLAGVFSDCTNSAADDRKRAAQKRSIEFIRIGNTSSRRCRSRGVKILMAPLRAFFRAARRASSAPPMNGFLRS